MRVAAGQTPAYHQFGVTQWRARLAHGFRGFSCDASLPELVSAAGAHHIRQTVDEMGMPSFRPNGPAHDGAGGRRSFVSPRAARCLRLGTAVVGILLALAVAGCGGGGGAGSERDPTPEKIDGSSSYEFEQEDLDTAEGVSDAVKEYCADAVSEAQRLGCESHVTEDELP